MVLAEVLDEIKAKRRELEDAEEALENITGKLEAIAKQFYKEGNKDYMNPGREHCCASGYFVYRGLVPAAKVDEAQQRWGRNPSLFSEDYVGFYSRCGYSERECGGGCGIHVPVSYIEAHL